MAYETFWLLAAIVAITVTVVLPRWSGLSLQGTTIGLAFAVLLSFSGCAGSISGQSYDPGGDPKQAMFDANDALIHGRQVEIKGACYSSCALKLAAGPRMCISPQSRIGVHEVRSSSRAGDYVGGVRDELWTGFFAGMLPACTRELFAARDGFASGRLTMASGSEILKACPSMHACAG